MDLFKPFKALFNHLVGTPVARYVEEQLDQNDHQPKRTPFEQRLVDAFKDCQNSDSYQAVRVSIIPASHAGPHSVMYQNRKTGQFAWGAYDVGLVERGKSLPQVMKEYNDCGFTVVMMLDPHGAPLEQQVPGWKRGTMEFPDRFTAVPLYTIGRLHEHPHKMAVGQSYDMHEAVGRTPQGERRAMPHYIRGVVDGGKNFTP